MLEQGSRVVSLSRVMKGGEGVSEIARVGLIRWKHEKKHDKTLEIRQVGERKRVTNRNSDEWGQFIQGVE